MKTQAKQNKADQYLKTTCRYCDAALGKSFLELGDMALANSYVPQKEKERVEFTCPLSVTRCTRCNLVQLTHVVPAGMMFSHYLYVSSTTKTFQDHFAEYAKSMRSKIHGNVKPVAVDIGSNDGLLVSSYESAGFKGIGIEPAANLSLEANKKGIETINRFFDSECADLILKKYGPVDVISANNVFAHIDDVRAVLRNVSKLLNPDGIFVIEFPYLVTMFEEMLFDMIYHEHLSYISVIALDYLLRRFDMQIFEIKQVSSHGGSLRVHIQKKSGHRKAGPEVARFRENEIQKGYQNEPVYHEFARRAMEIRRKLIQYVRDLKARGKTISGYGAPAKSSTIINFCHFTHNDIDFIVDDNPLKQNLYAPGAKIPIVPSTHLNAHPTDVVLIFAWNFAGEIIRKMESLKAKGVQFIIPLPEPKLIG